MGRFTLIVVAVFWLGFASRLTAAEPVQLNGHTFTLPDGFSIELVTGTEHTKRPIAATFDPDGNLYITEASGTNDPVQKQLADKPHTIRKLTDTDGDGKFDRSTVFADKLMLPQGIMWFNGSILVGTPPTIEKLTDTDGDGKADNRETWFDGKTLTNCANDLHGPYPGPDGWIYWTKGAFAKQEHTLPNGKKFPTRASHIFRAKPDGTGLEPVMTGGMDNPVDVAFSPTGDRFFTTTFLQHPAGGKRDGIIHAVYGGLYGKDHDPIYEHPWTGPDLLAPMTHLGAAAPCGLHCLESDQFGPEYRNNLFACCFNMHKVTRHVLVPTGSTYTTKDTDFLTSDNLDFHPTDVIEDADGSLLVVDTGGWYKLCCPTSMLVKPDVFGGIYRIRKTGSHKLKDPRGKAIDWKKATADELVATLGDVNPVVRQQAIEIMGSNPTVMLPLLEKAMRESKSPLFRQNALWAAARFDHLPNQTVHPGPGLPHVLLTCLNMARSALDDESVEVRLVALHLISIYRDKTSKESLIKVLRTGTHLERRLAAEALGRIGDSSSVSALLDVLKDPADRTLEHAVIYALIEIGDAMATAKGLDSDKPKVRRAATIALDQMPKGGLQADSVTKELESSDSSLREVVWWILSRHGEMGSSLVPKFRERLEKGGLANSYEYGELLMILTRLSANADVQKLLAETVLSKVNTPNDALKIQISLQAMSRSGLKTVPEVWQHALIEYLNSRSVNLSFVVLVIRAFPGGKSFPSKLEEAFRRIAVEGNYATSIVFAALDAIPNGLPEVPDVLFQQLIGRFARTQDSPSFIPEAASILSKSTLTSAQLVQVAEVFKTVGPIEQPKLLNAFSKSTDESVGLALLRALNDPKVRPSLRHEIVKPIFDKYPDSVKTAAQPLFAKLEAARTGERKKLEELVAETKDGDIRRGQVVFNSVKAACITCHSMGYLGGKTGPDLTRIGGVRRERDLLEAIVFPNASFVRSYEPVKVVTTDGRTLTGILKKDAPDEVLLLTNANDEVRVLRTDIESLTPGTISVMPSGLDQQLTKQDLADLIAFLRASK